MIIWYSTSTSGIIVFIKNAHKISRILPDFICKNNRFSARFLFWADAYNYYIWRAWYNGSYAMMAKPIGALELHYPMIQLLINVIYFWRVLLSWNDVKWWRKNSTWLQSMVSDVYNLLTHLACVAGAWNKERARAREGNTRGSLSRARSFLCPLLIRF